MDVVIKQSIGEFVRDNGGNAWVALGHALQALEAVEAQLYHANVQADGEQARAEAAEAEAAKWREMHWDRDHDLQHEYARAEAAEAECERLREVLNALVGEEPPMDSAEALRTR